MNPPTDPRVYQRSVVNPGAGLQVEDVRPVAPQMHPRGGPGGTPPIFSRQPPAPHSAPATMQPPRLMMVGQPQVPPRLPSYAKPGRAPLGGPDPAGQASNRGAVPVGRTRGPVPNMQVAMQMPVQVPVPVPVPMPLPPRAPARVLPQPHQHSQYAPLAVMPTHASMAQLQQPMPPRGHTAPGVPRAPPMRRQMQLQAPPPVPPAVSEAHAQVHMAAARAQMQQVQQVHQARQQQQQQQQVPQQVQQVQQVVHAHAAPPAAAAQPILPLAPPPPPPPPRPQAVAAPRASVSSITTTEQRQPAVRARQDPPPPAPPLPPPAVAIDGTYYPDLPLCCDRRSADGVHITRVANLFHVGRDNLTQANLPFVMSSCDQFERRATEVRTLAYEVGEAVLAELMQERIPHIRGAMMQGLGADEEDDDDGIARRAPHQHRAEQHQLGVVDTSHVMARLAEDSSLSPYLRYMSPRLLQRFGLQFEAAKAEMEKKGVPLLEIPLVPGPIPPGMMSTLMGSSAPFVKPFKPIPRPRNPEDLAPGAMFFADLQLTEFPDKAAMKMEFGFQDDGHVSRVPKNSNYRFCRLKEVKVQYEARFEDIRQKIRLLPEYVGSNKYYEELQSLPPAQRGMKISIQVVEEECKAELASVKALFRTAWGIRTWDRYWRKAVKVMIGRLEGKQRTGIKRSASVALGDGGPGTKRRKRSRSRRRVMVPKISDLNRIRDDAGKFVKSAVDNGPNLPSLPQQGPPPVLPLPPVPVPVPVPAMPVVPVPAMPEPPASSGVN